MGDATLSAAQRKQLREDAEQKHLSKYAKQYRVLAAEATALPLRVKTQYPAYLEVGMLHMMRGVAEIEGISVQAFLRGAIQTALDKRMKNPPKKRRSPSSKKAS